MGSWSGLFDFGYDHDDQLTSLRGDTVNLLERNLFAQRLRVRNTGFIFGQRLATFTPSFTLGFSQDNLTTGGESGLLVGDLLAYDLNALVLPDKPYNLRLFTTKSDTFTPLRFGGSTDVDVANRGATLSLRGSVLRSSLGYWERRLQITSTGIGSQDRDELRKNLSYRGTGAWDRNDLTLRLEAEDVDDKIFPRFSFGTRTADLYHRYRIFSNQADALTSSFRRFRRIGTAPEEMVNLEERLQARLKGGFFSQFSYSFQSRETEARSGVAHRIMTSVDHQLYESLRTSGLFQIGFEDRSDGEGRGVGARLGLAYSKSLPWSARMTADWGLRYDQQADRSDTGDREIVDEGHVARLGLPFQLENANVIAGSIVVTDADERAIFVPGVDYEVRTVGDFTEITPSVDGAIGEAEPLLVDYRVLFPRDVRFDVHQHRVGFGFQRGIWAASYGYSKSTSDTLEGDDEGLLNADTEVHRVSFGVNWSNARTTVALSNRYHREVQSQLDYALVGFSQVLRFNLNSRYVLGFDALEEFTDFLVPDRRTRRISGRSTLQWAAGPGLRVSALAALRLWEDTLSVNETFFEAGARAEWRFRSLDVRASLTRQYRWRGESGYEGMRITLRASRAF